MWSSRLVSCLCLRGDMIMSSIPRQYSFFFSFYIPLKLRVLLLINRFQSHYFKLVQSGLVGYDESYHARGTVFKAQGPGSIGFPPHRRILTNPDCAAAYHRF